jgi:hypothetical protein
MSFRVELKTTKLGYIKRQSSPKQKPSVKSKYAGKHIDWEVFRNRYALGGKIDKLYQAQNDGAIFKVGRVFNNIVTVQR